MPATVIVGLQWGDEGKGKTTDFLAEQVAMVVRYQGGDNAGHTVVSGDEVFKLRLTPSGVLYPHITSVIGSGVPSMTASPAASLSGMPLQKSCASCICAKPRMKYISAMSDAGVGFHLFRRSIAWLADVGTR